MMTRYLTEAECRAVAKAACDSYEMACSWRDAGRAAREYVADELGAKATDAQIAYCVRLAQLQWLGQRESVRKAMRDALTG